MVKVLNDFVCHHDLTPPIAREIRDKIQARQGSERAGDREDTCVSQWISDSWLTALNNEFTAHKQEKQRVELSHIVQSISVLFRVAWFWVPETFFYLTSSALVFWQRASKKISRYCGLCLIWVQWDFWKHHQHARTRTRSKSMSATRVSCTLSYTSVYTEYKPTVRKHLS